MSRNKMLYASLALVLLTSACSGHKTDEWFVTHNGNMPTNERISQIKLGESKEKVRDILGAPSTVVSLDQNTWIYMSSDIKRVAFFEPEEINRDVLTIRFDDQDQVIDISRLSKEHGKEIEISEDKTETLGEQPGLLEKTFGTLGKYNPFPGGTPM